MLLNILQGLGQLLTARNDLTPHGSAEGENLCLEPVSRCRLLRPQACGAIPKVKATGLILITSSAADTGVSL